MVSSGRRRIWILSELYYPEDSATGYYATRIAEALAVTHEVRVLCAQPTYKARGTRAPVDEIRNGVSIHRCIGTTLNKDILTFRIVNLLTISVSVFFNSLWRIRRGDIALVVTNPPTLPFVALVACKLCGAKLILRVEDVYPEALVAAGILGPRSIIVGALAALHRYLYRSVDRVIVLGRDMLRLVQSKIGMNTERVTVITNWADSDEIVPLDRSSNPLLRQLGLADKFVIQYSGNMGRTHDLECLLDSATMFQEDKGFHFLFVGAGAKEPQLRKRVQELGLSNVTILPWQPRTELSTLLNACDVAVISFVSGMSGVSVPSRMYNILAAGKPILAVAESTSELACVVRENQIGWVVESTSPDQIVHVLRDAASHRAQLSEMSKRARSVAANSFSLPQVMQKFEELLSGLERSEVRPSESVV